MATGKTKPLLEPTVEDEDWIKILAWKRTLRNVKSKRSLERMLWQDGLTVEQFKRFPAYTALRDEIPILKEI